MSPEKLLELRKEAVKGVSLRKRDEDYLMAAEKAGRDVAGLARVGAKAWAASWFRQGKASGRALGKTPKEALEKAVDDALRKDYQEVMP